MKVALLTSICASAFLLALACSDEDTIPIDEREMRKEQLMPLGGGNSWTYDREDVIKGGQDRYHRQMQWSGAVPRELQVWNATEEEWELLGVGEAFGLFESRALLSEDFSLLQIDDEFHLMAGDSPVAYDDPIRYFWYQLPLRPEEGSRYRSPPDAEGHFSIVEWKELDVAITVPAGSFSTMLLELERFNAEDQLQMRIRRYFAPSVGPVMIELEHFDEFGLIEHELNRLSSYEIE